jgi:hypothetical protein
MTSIKNTKREQGKQSKVHTNMDNPIKKWRRDKENKNTSGSYPSKASR